MNSLLVLASYQKPRRRKIASTFVVAVLSISFSVSGIACKGKAETPAVNNIRTPDSAPQNSYADVVSRVAPAVVTIHADKRVRQPEQFPFFDDPFGGGLGNRNREQQQQPRQQLERALGSGVIVSADGYIITNHHVIDGAEDIQID